MFDRVFFAMLAAGALFAPISYAAGDSAVTESHAIFHAISALQMGQIQEANYNVTLMPRTIQPIWMTQMLLNVGAEYIAGPHLTLRSGVEGKLWYNTYPRSAIHLISTYMTADKNFTFYFDRADGTWSLGSPERAALQMQLGLFPFKYNPDARNLGEFLFRSGTYPAFLIGEFDYPLARLLGARVGVSVMGKLTADLLLTNEMDFASFNDFSLSGLAAYSPWKFLTMRAGVCFSHLISVYDSATTPPFASNSYLTDNGDTAYYTFRGTKLMAGIALDPKRIFLRDNAGIFGENDLRLYAEAAILGVKNYPASNANPYGYDTLSRKLPVLLGLNVPCFKILDVLAIEAEWYGCRYPNSYQEVASRGFPLPASINLNRDSSDYANDDWKWSVYASKSLGKNFKIVGQVARDHLRHLSQFVENVDREEMFSTKGHWYWMTKAEFRF
jgi:hypothetical protein